MRPKETLRDYTDRFFENHNKLVGLKDDHVMDYYKKGIKDLKLFEKIHEAGATTIVDVMMVVNKLVDTQDAVVYQFSSNAQHVTR
jgi:hypothetical protein